MPSARAAALLATTAAFSAILAFILVGRRRRKQTVSDARPQVTRRSDSRKDPFEDFRIDFSCMQQNFEPYVASGAQPLRFVLHTHAGMERLALNEVIAMPKSMDAVQLFGKVAFSSTLPVSALRTLRSAEDLSLLCWAAPTTTALDDVGVDPREATDATTGNLASSFREFYSSRSPEAAAWLRRLEVLLRSTALPALRKLESAWRAAAGMEVQVAPSARSHGSAAPPLSFRASVKRSGKDVTARGVTSVCMEQLLGGLVVELLGWRVDLKRPDLNLVLQWNEAQAMLELPLRRHRASPTPSSPSPSTGLSSSVPAPPDDSHSTCLPSGEALRPWVPAGALRGPVSWALARLADETRAEAHHHHLNSSSSSSSSSPSKCSACCCRMGVVLDPCVGRGGLLVEAALACHAPARPDDSRASACCCRFIGVDEDSNQLAAACAAARRAGMSHNVSFVRGDCTALPLASASIDTVLVDLPFGKQHKAKGMALSELYERSVAEAARVCRPGGVLVALSTHKHMLSRAVRSDARWEPATRHELSFGGLTAFAVAARRVS